MENLPTSLQVPFKPSKNLRKIHLFRDEIIDKSEKSLHDYFHLSVISSESSHMISTGVPWEDLCMQNPNLRSKSGKSFTQRQKVGKHIILKTLTITIFDPHFGILEISSGHIFAWGIRFSGQKWAIPASRGQNIGETSLENLCFKAEWLFVVIVRGKFIECDVASGSQFRLMSARVKLYGVDWR